MSTAAPSPGPQAGKPGVAANSAFDMAAQLAVLAISLVGGIVLSRMLGADGRGRYVYATFVLSSLLLGLANMGAALAAQVFCARDRSRLAEIHSLGVLVSLGAGWGLGAVLLLARPLFPATALADVDPLHLALVCGALPFQIYLAVAYGILVGLGDVRLRSVFEVSYQLLQSLAVIGLIVGTRRLHSGEPITPLVCAYFGIMACASPVLARLVGRSGPIWARPGPGLAREFLRYGRDIWIGGIANELAWRLDQVIVHSSLGPAQLGIYNLATSNAARSAIAAAALTRSLYARVCSLPAAEASALCARAFRQLVLVGAAMLVLGIVAVPLIPLVYGREFAPSGPLFLIVLCGWLPHNASRVLAMYFTGHLARPDIPMKLNWSLLPVQLALTWWLVGAHGVWGAAIATAGSYLLIATSFLVLFVRRPETPPLRDLCIPRGSDLRDWGGFLRR